MLAIKGASFFSIKFVIRFFAFAMHSIIVAAVLFWVEITKTRPEYVFR